jgi:hypothetical protein
MKNAILVLALIATACTKTKTVTVTATPVHDTVTTPAVHDTVAAQLVGAWTNNVSSNSKPVFTLDSVYWNGINPYRYVASGDTLFYAYADRSIYPQYVYTISADGDTLTLREVPPFNRVLVYWR